VAAWIAARGSGPGNKADAREWLNSQNIGELLSARLRPILLRLWADAWDAGVDSAEEVTGYTGGITAQPLQDLLNQYSFAWTNEIASTRLDRIAAILASGGTAEQITAQIKAVLSSEDGAKAVAMTEVTRAIGAATAEVYRLANVGRVRWVIEDQNACELCKANAKAEPRYLGVPFPSGAAMPPQHVRCRCALIPE
jgi:hypothetical protein